MKMSIDDQLKDELDMISVSDKNKHELLEKCRKLNRESLDNSLQNKQNLFKKPVYRFIPWSLAACIALVLLINQTNIFSNIYHSYESDTANELAMETTAASFNESSEISETEALMVLEDGTCLDTTITKDAYVESFDVSSNNSSDNSGNINQSQNNFSESEAYGTVLNEDALNDLSNRDYNNVLYEEDIKNSNYIATGSINSFEEIGDGKVNINASVTTFKQNIDNEFPDDQIINFTVSKDKFNDISLSGLNYLFILKYEDNSYITDDIQKPIIVDSDNVNLLDHISSLVLTVW